MAHPAEGAPADRRAVVREVLAWLALAVAVAAALRFYRLGANSLWVDEFATLATAQHPLDQIPQAALRGDAFEPPLFFWATHLIIRSLGNSEATVRILSALAGVLTVPLVWLLLRELGTGAASASLSALLLSVNPLHLWYSQEARPYALVVCLGLVSLLALLVALRNGRTMFWAGFAGFGALAILTHAVGGFFPIVGLIWVMLSDRPNRSLRGFAIASIIILGLISPFLIALARAVAGAQGTGSPPRGITGLELPYTLFTFVGGYSLGPAVREIQDLGWAAAVRSWPGQTVLGVAALAACTVLILPLRSRAAVCLAVLLAVPLAAAFTGAVATGKAYNVRYTVPALVGFLALVALGIVRLGPRLAPLAGGLLLIVFLWGDLQWFQASRYWKEDSRGAVACLGRALPDGGLVAVAPSYMTPVLEYYAARSGTGLRPWGVHDTSDLSRGPRPQVLLISRLHHVPDAVALVRAFQATGNGIASSATVPGYRIHFNGPGAQVAAAACRAGA